MLAWNFWDKFRPKKKINIGLQINEHKKLNCRIWVIWLFRVSSCSCCCVDLHTVQNMSTEPSNSKDPKSVYDFTLKVVIYLFHFTSFFLSLSVRFHLTTTVLFIYIFKTFFFLFSSIPILQDGMGNDVDLATYKGKVLLIVNVASKWYVYPTILSFIKRTCKITCS